MKRIEAQAQIIKLMRSMGHTNVRMLASRNKREGWYAGRFNGKHLRGAPPPPHNLGQMIAAMRVVWREATVFSCKAADVIFSK